MQIQIPKASGVSYRPASFPRRGCSGLNTCRCHLESLYLLAFRVYGDYIGILFPYFLLRTNKYMSIVESTLQPLLQWPLNGLVCIIGATKVAKSVALDSVYNHDIGYHKETST